MFKRIVTILKQLMGFQSIPASVPAETTVSKPVKQPRVKSGQASQSAKRKPSATQSTKAAPSRKRASKPAQTTSGKRGRPRKTPV
jgi:electron transfer flavoprotein alpha/beta subunit